jgi:uroporphyrinogen decarboxylase
MTSRERILCALRREEPDRVPYHEPAVSGPIIKAFTGQALTPEGLGGIVDMEARGSREEFAVTRALRRDHVSFRAIPPVPMKLEEGSAGIVYTTEGGVTSLRDLENLELPDPEGEAFWADAVPLVEQAHEQGLAACVCTRVGIAPVYLALGTAQFALALYDNRALVEGLLERYTDWGASVVRRAAEFGFDYVQTSDDLAHKTGTFVSPGMLREIFLPRMRKVAGQVRTPWIHHSDGDVSEIIGDLVDLGVSALNPIEPEAMDIVRVKKQWGRHLCLIGNVSVHLLAAGAPDEIVREVRRLLREVAPGGGYILASGNSLASYCKPENARAMIDTLQRFGAYPITGA